MKWWNKILGLIMEIWEGRDGCNQKRGIILERSTRVEERLWSTDQWEWRRDGAPVWCHSGPWVLGRSTWWHWASILWKFWKTHNCLGFWTPLISLLGSYGDNNLFFSFFHTCLLRVVLSVHLTLIILLFFYSISLMNH